MGETLRTTPHMPAHGFSLAVNFQNEKRTIDIGAGRDHKVARNFRSRRREVWVYKSRWREAPKDRLGGWFGRGSPSTPSRKVGSGV